MAPAPSALYEYVPHPHIHERKAQAPHKTVDQRRLQHPNPVVRFNARLGLLITVVVGTMWAAYVFAGVALISLPSNLNSTQNFILWLSSSFLQLVLLPIIIVGQNIQAKAADQRAIDTYKDAEAVLHETEHIQMHLDAQDQKIVEIAQQLQALKGA
jgi:hypothetical protein